MSQKKIRDPLNPKISKGKLAKLRKRAQLEYERRKALSSTRSDRQLVSPTTGIYTDPTVTDIK